MLRDGTFCRKTLEACSPLGGKKNTFLYCGAEQKKFSLSIMYLCILIVKSNENFRLNLSTIELVVPCR